MDLGKGARILAGMALVLALVAGVWFLRRAPQEQQLAAAPQITAETRTPVPSSEGIVADNDLRSLRIYEFRKAANSGPDRGREIFYYKCWFCHNEFAGKTSAPDLATVYKREKLLSGRPATDDGIKDEIRNGGEGMAAYKYVLNEADLNDLVAYIRDHCCWDSTSPPPNPRYRGEEALTQ